MKNFDLNSLGVQELGKTQLVEVNGGQEGSPWWWLAESIIRTDVTVLQAAAEAYVEYSEETGGQYVIHHTQ